MLDKRMSRLRMLESCMSNFRVLRVNSTALSSALTGLRNSYFCNPDLCKPAKRELAGPTTRFAVSCLSLLAGAGALLCAEDFLELLSN